MWDNVFNVRNIDTTYTEDPGGWLGSKYLRRNPTTGNWETWIFVKNGGANPWAVGDIVGRRDGQTTYDCDLVAVSSPAMRVAGVAQHVIAAGYYGFVLREGLGEVLADTGAITANYALVVGNAVAGRADDRAANTDHAFAFSTEAALATATATCHIYCIG